MVIFFLVAECTHTKALCFQRVRYAFPMPAPKMKCKRTNILHQSSTTDTPKWWRAKRNFHNKISSFLNLNFYEPIAYRTLRLCATFMCPH